MHNDACTRRYTVEYESFSNISVYDTKRHNLLENLNSTRITSITSKHVHCSHIGATLTSYDTKLKNMDLKLRSLRRPEGREVAN